MSLGVDISIQRIIVLAMLLGFGSSPALACSCGNSTPIDRTVQKYSERAVFTARIVQLMGKIYDWDGKRYSDVALAIVHERYWGLPWYWPKVVVLNGKYPCDIAMSEGEEYLVSGRRMRYGVLDVARCSRTQLLRTAQIDLRTLDGSHCSSPGGTILGKLFAPTDQKSELKAYPGKTVTLTNSSGNRYSGTTDSEGVFELRHLPAGKYVIDPGPGGNKGTNDKHVEIRDGVCLDAGNYSVELLPPSMAGLGLTR